MARRLTFNLGDIAFRHRRLLRVLGRVQFAAARVAPLQQDRAQQLAFAPCIASDTLAFLNIASSLTIVPLGPFFLEGRHSFVHLGHQNTSGDAGANPLHRFSFLLL